MSFSRDVVVNTLLGPGSTFCGDIVVDGFVRVDGEFRGSIRTTGKIVVSELARCDASILARSAVIGGVVRGDVCVLERLSMLNGGVIVGNVFAPKLDADGEVVIHGDVEVSGRLEDAESALLTFLGRHERILSTRQDSQDVSEIPDAPRGTASVEVPAALSTPPLKGT